MHGRGSIGAVGAGKQTWLALHVPRGGDWAGSQARAESEKELLGTWVVACGAHEPAETGATSAAIPKTLLQVPCTFAHTPSVRVTVLQAVVQAWSL